MDRNNNEVVADLVTKFVTPTVLDLETPDGTKAPLLILPEGLKAHSVKKLLEEFRDQPERRKGQADLTDLASFILHANRFADQDSVIFVNTLAAPSMLIVFDYHRGTENTKGADSGARFCQHRGRYLFPLSDEWKTWTGANGVVMEQARFAEFIENRIVDIDDIPREQAKALATQLGTSYATASKLFELSRGLSIRVNSKVGQARNLASGEAQITYSSEHQDESGAPLKVPGAFVIAVPVFKGGARYQLPVRLRYRVKEQSVVWFLELYRSDLVFEHAVREACDRAKTETGLPILYGAPEA